MPAWNAYHLTFRSGLHIGTRGVNPEETGVVIPSDTLFAALYVAWARWRGDGEPFAKRFFGAQADPPFLLTSTFPYAGGVRFYPMPVDAARLFSPNTISDYGKRLKRIHYFSEGLLQKALQDPRLDDWLFPLDEDDEPKTGVALQNGALWLTLAEVESLPQNFRLITDALGKPRRRPAAALRYLPVWASGHVPHVVVSRVASTPTLYHTGKVVYSAGCGLWFGVHWRQPEAALAAPDNRFTYQAAFTQALDLLGQDGLGGRRSTGHGAFTYEKLDQPALPVPAAGELGYLLSRYHPKRDEVLPALVDNLTTAYQLTSVGGWLQSPSAPAQRRKRLYLVTEGSLVILPGELSGDVVDVQPEYENPQGALPHRVYRYGLACALRWPVSRSGGDHA
jgi:CRISPR-associated protein Csm4